MELEKAIDLLRELVDPEACSWDHNHSCQTHGYFYLDQGEMCPVEEAKQLIAQYDRENS